MKRRTFLLSSLALSLELSAKSNHLPLAFSTLGCPDWTWPEILDNATKWGFSGVELRGIGPDLDILESPVFASSRLSETRRQILDAGISIFNVGSSAHLHAHDPIERARQLDQARRYVDLAQALDCAYVRVFPNEFPAGFSREATLEKIQSGLTLLADHARGSKVKILLETHGDVVESRVLAQIMQVVNRKEVGLIWDPFNMWIKTSEDIMSMYTQLSPWIRHVHLKDARVSSSGFTYVPCGEGNFPLEKVIRILKEARYPGFYSLEWEKKWHPSIAPPEAVFPQFVSYMKNFT